MKTREILSIVALVALGLCLICGLVKVTMKGPKAKHSCDHACSLSLFVAVVLVGVSQLLEENRDGYKNVPDEKCGEMKQMKTLTNTTVSPPLKCNSPGITGNCKHIDSSATIVKQCGDCVDGKKCDGLNKGWKCFSYPGDRGYQEMIKCTDEMDNVIFTTA